MKEIFKAKNISSIIMNALFLIILPFLFAFVEGFNETAKFFCVPSLGTKLSLLFYPLAISCLIGSIIEIAFAITGLKHDYDDCLKYKFVIITIHTISFTIFAVVTGLYLTLIFLIPIIFIIIERFNLVKNIVEADKTYADTQSQEHSRFDD